MTEIDHTSPCEKTLLEGLYEKLVDDIANRVIQKISEDNSTWLNNIQYKVKAENVEGLEQYWCAQLDTHRPQIVRWATDDLDINEIQSQASDSAEEAINSRLKDLIVSADDVDGLEDAVKQIIENCTFNVDVSVS